MIHPEAVERVREMAACLRSAAKETPEETEASLVIEDLANAEALETLLAAVAHMPVGGDKKPLWPGLAGWRNKPKPCGCPQGIPVKIDAIEVHGLEKRWMVRKFGHMEGGLYDAKDIFSTCEAVEKGAKG
jgi:hypothetical protein